VKTGKLPMTEAAASVGLTRQKLWALVKKGRIRTYDDPLDDRRKLVDISELKKLLEAYK
jgi:DNA-binding MarR family transcriptional regulator